MARQPIRNPLGLFLVLVLLVASSGCQVTTAISSLGRQATTPSITQEPITTTKTKPPPTQTQPTPNITSPAPAPPLSGKDVFRSDKYHLAVRVPPNWGKSEGPENISHILEGQVAFNSWGEDGFWTHEVITENTATYSSGIVMAQIHQGGAYIVLVEAGGPPPAMAPTEYLLNNLNGLILPQDWRLRADREVGFHAFAFYKWGTSFVLQIACSPNASDATVAEINSILASWQFDTR